MALANVAWNLAVRHGLRVVVVDWDLEAPGLHRFFGYGDDGLQDQVGVLDFLHEWSERRTEGVDVAPPVVPKEIHSLSSTSLEPAAVPLGHGSIGLVVAGKRTCATDGDEYVEHLWKLNWTKLYEENAGREALRVFRDALASSADVVLVDSRTGLTDIGGICTLALPDAVVLFTAASEQSWEGTVFTARGIRREDAKHDRKTQIWLCVSRIPLVGELELTEEWFRNHEEKFKDGARKRLWRDEDHPKGLRTFRIPHSGRWTIGEQVLTDAPTDDLLVRAYADLAEALAVWVKDLDPTAPVAPQDRPQLEESVAREEERGDLTCLARDLIRLARVQLAEGSLDQAALTLERSRGLAEGRGDRRAWVLSLALLADTRRKQGREDEADRLVERAAAVLAQGNDTAAIKDALRRVGVDPERWPATTTASAKPDGT